MLNLEQVRQRLKDRNVSLIAREIGLSRQTIAFIANGASCNAETLEKLSKYFEEQEK